MLNIEAVQFMADSLVRSKQDSSGNKVFLTRMPERSCLKHISEEHLQLQKHHAFKYCQYVKLCLLGHTQFTKYICYQRPLDRLFVRLKHFSCFYMNDQNKMIFLLSMFSNFVYLIRFY